MYVHICAKYVARSFVMQTIAIAIHGQDYVDGNVVPTFICETHRNFQKYRTTLCPSFIVYIIQHEFLLTSLPSWK